MYYCNQCFDSIKSNQFCPHEYCERRLKETGSARKQEQKKMTRQEANDRALVATGAFYGDQLIRGLEALGLIKFEEEKRLSAEAIITKYWGQGSAKVIIELREAGYKIVRED